MKEINPSKIDHEKQKRFKKHSCDICEKKFFQMPALEMHIIIVHLWLKVFKCDLCENKSYQHYLALKDHVKLFHATKVYTCDTCEKEFEENSKLKQHKKEHHHNHDSTLFQRESISEANFKVEIKEETNEDNIFVAMQSGTFKGSIFYLLQGDNTVYGGIVLSRCMVS